jgi:hypothetical protein
VGEEESLESHGSPSIRSIRIKGTPNRKRQNIMRSSARSLTPSIPQKNRQYGKKISSFGLFVAGTQEDLLESSDRNFGNTQESARKMVNYSKKDLINRNVDESQKKGSPIKKSNSGLNNRANESRIVLLGESIDRSKTTRELSLPSRKINEKGLIKNQTNTKISVFRGSRPQMNYFPNTLGEIAEDDHELVPETPIKGKNSPFVELQVKPMAMPVIKDHPVTIPGVDDQIEPSKVKYTRRSTIMEVPNKHKKKDKHKGTLANLEPARLSPISEENYRRAASLEN